MIRSFAVADIDGTLVAHDPAVGTNHLPPKPIPTGRIGLDDQQVGSWPEANLAGLRPIAPLSMCWSAINRCNLACPHCLDDKGVRESTPEQRRAQAASITRAGVLGVDMSGGEPLLLRDLPDLARAIHNDSATVVSCTTNGWHLARRAHELAPAFDALRVSLDGGTQATHDSWRGEGSHQRAIRGIRAAIAEELPIQLQMVLMRSTRHEAQLVIDTAHRLGVIGVTFLQMLPIGEGQAIAQGEMLSDDEARETVAALTIPDTLRVRLRTRDSADGFTVLRTDGYAWRNTGGATAITAFVPVNGPDDLRLPANSPYRSAS